MAVEGGMKCLKVLMMIFNFIFLLAGLILFVVGIVVEVKFSAYTDVLGGDLSKAPYVTIAVGLVIMVIAFFGCCGAWKENHCMMMTYAVLLTLVLILEIVATSLAVVYKDQVHEIVKKGLQEALPAYQKNDIYRKAINNIQKDLKCCGIANYTDWKANNLSVPSSCCIKDTECPPIHPPAPNKASNIFAQGCLEALEDWCMSHLTTVAGAAGALCVIEVLGILFACCLARAINSQYEVV